MKNKNIFNYNIMVDYDGNNLNGQILIYDDETGKCVSRISFSM